jgi:hypothetical protein
MKKILTTLLLMLLFSTAIAQVNKEKQDSLSVITLNSGETRIGKILSDDGREILLETTDIGKIYIRKETIKSIEPFIAKDFQNVQGELRGAGPFTTRYCFTTNSLPIKKGENYAMVNLYGPEVHFSVSNRLSLGIMSTWIGSPMLLAAKFTIPTKNEKLNFGLGTLFGTSGYLNTFRGLGGLHWGMVTYGDRMRNITFSAGFSYIKTGTTNYNIAYPAGTYPAQQADWDPNQYNFVYPTYKEVYSENPTSTAPAFGISGITKVGKKASLIFDAMVFIGSQKRAFNQEIIQNYDPTTGQPDYLTIPEPTYNSKSPATLAFFMPAMRFQTTDNKAFQIALAGALLNTSTESIAFPVPMCSWFFKF